MKLLKCCLLFFTFLPQSSWANTMTLDSYLESLKREDLELKRFVHQRVQTRFNKDLSLPNAGWLTQITHTYGIASGVAKSRTSETTASVTKNFRDTGTNLNLSYNENDLADRAEEVRSAQVAQSLIRNPLGLRTGQIEDRIKEENRVVFLQVLESYEDYVAEKIIQYLDLILAYENLKTAQSLYSDIQKLWKEVNKRKDNNIALGVDVDRATAQKLQFERAVLEAKISLQSLQKSLVAAFDRSKPINFTPQKEIPFIKKDMDLSQKPLEAQRTMEILAARETAASFEISQRKRDLYPEGEFILGYRHDESQRFSTIVNREETVFGLNFEYSFDNTLNEAQVDQAQYNKTQVEIERIRTKKELDALLSDLKQRIQIQNQRVKLLSRQQVVLKRLIGGEQGRFTRGRVDLETLINTQNTYAQVRFDLVAQKIELAKNIVRWKQNTDQLISEESLQQTSSNN